MQEIVKPQRNADNVVGAWLHDKPPLFQYFRVPCATHLAKFPLVHILAVPIPQLSIFAELITQHENQRHPDDNRAFTGRLPQPRKASRPGFPGP